MTRGRLLPAALLLIVPLFAAGPAAARDIVPMRGYERGVIVVRTSARELFYVLGNGQAIRYPVGVCKAGLIWHGHAYVAQKLRSPAWRRSEDSPAIPGGSPRNPMGVAVLGLNRGNYAIHGTNDPSSIGGFVSHGCIRMYNEDVSDLYRRTPLGTDVYVVR